MTAQFQSLVTVVVDGVTLGIFQKRSGGDTTSETSKYRPGGMQKQRVRNGQTEHDDVTVSREWEVERDAALVRSLRIKCGAAPMVVTDQPLDGKGAVFGKPEVFSGVLMSVAGGESDSESNDGRELELVMMTTEVA